MVKFRFVQDWCFTWNPHYWKDREVDHWCIQIIENDISSRMNWKWITDAFCSAYSPQSLLPFSFRPWIRSHCWHKHWLFYGLFLYLYRGHAILHLAVSVSMSVCRYIRQSHFWISSCFRITAPAQPSTTGLPCIRPCLLINLFPGERERRHCIRF